MAPWTSILEIKIDFLSNLLYNIYVRKRKEDLFMYLKIETEYRTYILRVTDIRNVSTGHDGNHYVVYVFYRCGTDSDTTIRCGDRDERDEICEKIYQALVAWEGMLG